MRNLKRVSLVALLMFVVSMGISAQSSRHSSSKHSSTQTIYYVVVGSFSSLSEASTFANNAPCDTEWGNIYKATKDGKTLYRVCTGCYYSKAKAQQQVNEKTRFAREWGLGIKPWIWANKGQAKCVERMIAADGSYYPTRPE